MNAQFARRICNVDGKVLPIDDKDVQSGWYCCDEYFCSQECLDKSFEGTDTNWKEHYSDDGDCYFTEWEFDPLEEAAA